MPIDTAEKRASAIGIGLPFRLTLPVASGTIDQGERQHVCGLYAGILAGAARIAGRLMVAAFQINLSGAESVQTRTLTGAEVMQTVESGAATVQTF